MIRRAEATDLDFLIQIDLKDEGVTTSDISMTEEDLKEHSSKILKFVTEQDRGAFIFEDEKIGKRIGLIMYSIVNRDYKFPWKTIFHELDRSLFQEDGRFVEIFQLWVAPENRRTGIATKLKLKLEELAKTNNVNLIYTHTEERNKHVIELNEKLGYRIVRSGPIWDEIVRVILIKQIQKDNVEWI
ncbi:GNAT family N-acetyltransferase [Paenibacillus albiflavus]|uniref:GNAT family N-acetyltransferase n=1 Tax=Paenibacillus albiflavus TaxID=2545760 RepID=A0A4R4EGV8_9BACL|nr:GNAT family N-acetyltransferase [Paenibacillus albiflavus]TCZ79326.1 GNAT family N-acetyltransferase [Paenibacillus albiflavus]